MSRVLIVEESTILCGMFKRLLEKDGSFEYDIAQNYKEAGDYLDKNKYDFSVASRGLPDAGNGEIIALLNKYDISPIVYTTSIDENIMESFESANVVEYILKHRHDNVKYAISRLKRLKENEKTTILVVHKSEIHRRYIRQNLLLHKFNVIHVDSAYEALQKLEVHPEIKLMIVNNELEQVSGLQGVDGVELVRKVKNMKLDNLRIISLASESNSYLTTRFLNEGADDYLICDYSRAELYVRIYQNLKYTE